MKDKQKTKDQLVRELEEMRARVAELEALHVEKSVGNPQPPSTLSAVQVQQEIPETFFEKQVQTFSNIVRQAAESIIVTDLQGRITYINPAAERLFGYSLEEVIGKDSVIFNAESDPLAYQNEIMQTLRCGETFRRDALNRRKDGSTFWISLNISPLRDRDGSIYGFMGLQQDITGRKEAEKNLRESEMLLSETQRIARMGTWVFEVESQKITWSDQTFRIWGRDPRPEGPAWNEYFESVHPDDRQILLDSIDKAMKGEPYENELRHLRPDGTYNYTLTHCQPVVQNGKTVRLIGSVLDITERKYVEKLAISERDLNIGLNKAATLTEALKICLDTAIDISEIDSGGIYLRNETSGDFDLVVHKGLSDTFVNAASTFKKESPGVRIVMEGKPVYFNYEKPDAPVNKSALVEGLKATAVLPIRYKNQILGCLNIGSHSLGEMPSLLRVGLETIVSHIGAAIVNARQDESLHQSRQNYDMLFNTVQDFIVITDGKGNIIHANEITYKKLGYRKEELLGQPVLMLHPKETHDEAIKKIDAMLLGKEDTCMIPLEAKDGTRIPVETKVWLGKWDGQDAVFGISRDVTARKQFEAALQESKDELQSVLDNSPIPIGTFDGNHFIYTSKAWHELTGQKQAERPGIDFFISRLHPEDMEHVLAIWQESWHKKVSGVAFFRLKDYSGSYRHFAGSITPVFDRSGEFKYFFGYLLDVTELKQTETALLESQQRLEFAVNGARVGLWDWSVQTEQIIINERWAEIIGYSLAELIPVDFKKWAQLIHPDDLKKSNEALERYFAGETDYYECEVRLKHKNGEWVWVLARGKVFEWDKDGKPMRMTGTHLDITDRKQAEFALINESVRRRLLFEQAKDGIVILDRDRKTVEANKSFADMLGYTADEMLRLYAWDWEANYPSQEEFLAKWPELPITSDTVETRHRRKDGTMYDVEVSWNPMVWMGQHLLYCVCRDITDRKRIEASLQKSEALYRSILKASPDDITITDIQGHIRMISPSGLKMFGNTQEEEVLGHLVTDLLVPEDRERAQSIIVQMLQGGVSGPTEYRGLRADGTVFDIEVNAEIIRDVAGQPTGIVSIVRDITDRKRADEALRESEELYISTLKASPDSIAIYDLQGVIRIASPSKLKLLGYTREEEVVGHSIRKFVHPKDHERVQHDIGCVLQGISIGVNEYSALHADGRVFAVESNAEVIRDAAGNPTGIVVITRDITDRKRAEEALRESEKRFRTIFYTSPDAIVITRLEDGFLVDYNPSASRLTGYTKEDALGKSTIDINIWADLKDRQEVIRRLKETGYCDNFEFGLKRKDGSTGTALMSATMMVLQGVSYMLSITRDISEIRRVEKVIQQSERNYREIFNATTEAIFLHDAATGDLLDVNVAMVRMYGYNSKEEILASSRHDLTLNEPPYTEESAMHWIRLAIEEGPQVFEWRAKKKNGDLFWVEVSLRSTEIGGEGRILAVVRDITERKRTEEAMKESEDRFRRIFYTAPDAVIITRVEDGLFVDVNHSFTLLTGYTREEVIGNTSPAINIWADLKDRQEMVRRIKESGRCENFEFSVRKKDGTIGTGLMSASAMVLQGVPHIVSITRDITERKRVEEEIRKLSKVVTQSPVSVVITDTSGQITYVNPKFSEATGYAFEEAKGKNPGILKSGETSAEDYKTLWETITSGNVWQGRFHNKKKNGGLFWEDATISPIFDENNRITHFVAIKEDITQRIVLEQQLRQSQKLEAIGRLAGGVAHDFNNLLLVINGFSDLLLIKMPPDSRHYEHVQQIQRAGDRAAALTRQLLAFSRKQILQPKILHLTALIRDMEKMLRRIIGEDINLFTRYEEDLYKIKADPGQIEQVILNLAVNARDAMPSGGSLTIESQNAYLDEDYIKSHEGCFVGHYAMIAITDTGSGIDKQLLPHIFEPFFTTKEVGKGTGLGLSTVYGIVKQSGGNIWVYSEPGVGTTFKIYFPSFECTCDVERAPVKSKNAIRGTETLLVVEDDDIVRGLIMTGLEDLGYTVIIADSGVKALELIGDCAEEIDLLLTDVVMPQMSGRELADKVTVRCPKIKALFMSGYTDSAIVHHGVLDEGVAFIQKPFTIPEIAKKIRTVLDEKP